MRVFGIPLLILMLAWFVVGCDTPAKSASGQGVEGPLRIQGVGYVEPCTEIRRLSFARPGIIGTELVVLGEVVKAGSLLMRLECGEELAAVRLAEAHRAETQAALELLQAGAHPDGIRALEGKATAAQAELDMARQEADRAQVTFKAQASSAAEYDRVLGLLRVKQAHWESCEREASQMRHWVRKEDLAAAAARVAVAAAQREAARATLALTELRSPIDGVVLEILRRPGESSGSPTGESARLVGDTEHLRVRAEIDEAQVAQLHRGLKASVRPRVGTATAIAAKITDVKRIMGKKTVFANMSVERKDIDVLQVFIELPAGTRLPLGLEMDVEIFGDTAATGLSSNGPAPSRN